MQQRDRRPQGRLPDYQKLVADYAERVYRQAVRMLGSREDAEDATQEVFLKVYNGLANFRGEAQVATWIYRITFNTCVALRQKRRFEYLSTQDNGEDPMHSIPDPGPRADETLGERDRLEKVSALIARLPEREAAAITLFYIEQQSYADISRILEIPPGSVATALHNGRERLKKLLKEDRA